MSSAAHWLYVDDRRTHEVRAVLERGRTLDFVITESIFGNSLPEERYVERHTLAEPWEERMHVLALEARLARLGRYYKGGAAGWTPVRPAQADRAVDLAPLQLAGDASASDTIEFHHFNGPDRHAVTLVGVHQQTPRGRRSLLVRLDYQFPDTDGGNLQIVHAKLPPVLYRSALASQHLEMAELHFRKVETTARQMADPRTWAALRAALDGLLARLVEETSAEATAALRDGMGRPLDITSAVLVTEALRGARGAASKDRQYQVDNELDGPATAVGARKPDMTIEEVPDDLAAALNEPRLLALHARWLTPAREAELIASGHRAIGAAMRDVRGKIRPDEQHLVSLLEASLLLRHAFKKRTPVDPEVINRVRHARVYL